jgi:hypothetical protein
MFSRQNTAAISIILFPILNLSASYKDEVHYNQLVNELSLRGISVPTGAGVGVTQVEAGILPTGNYRPNPSNSEFSEKTITDVSNLGQDPSNHGTRVGRNLYGNTSSISPGITAISVFEANHFINSGWYSGTPSIESNPLQNHSWVSWLEDSNAPRRMDYAVNRDGFLPIVGINNPGSQSTPSDIPDTYGSIYNGITVGVSDGTHRYGTTTYDGAGRTKPEIVAPGGIPGYNPANQYTSFATPVITAAAALLIDAAGSNAAAKDQLTLKAILLAGADKSISTNWDQTPNRPIDDVYGAGELDIYQSYFIQQGGQQIAGSTIGTHGWNLSNLGNYSSETYTINISSGFRLRNISVLVTWNRKVTKQVTFFNTSFNPSLANMNLELTDDSDNSNIQSSDSGVDNIEHIWRDLGSELEAGSYTLTVATDDSVQYAIAWRSELFQDYTLWSSTAFTSSTPLAEQDSNDDPDGDGIENQLEQAFGGDPETSDLSILPISETIEDDGQSYLQISYRKPDFENGLNYTVETVTDLNGTWSSSTSEVELISITSETGGYDRYTYRRVAPLPLHEKAFLRVSVTQ